MQGSSTIPSSWRKSFPFAAANIKQESKRVLCLAQKNYSKEEILEMYLNYSYFGAERTALLQ